MCKELVKALEAQKENNNFQTYMEYIDDIAFSLGLEIKDEFEICKDYFTKEICSVHGTPVEILHTRITDDELEDYLRTKDKFPHMKIKNPVEDLKFINKSTPIQRGREGKEVMEDEITPLRKLWTKPEIIPLPIKETEANSTDHS